MKFTSSYVTIQSLILISLSRETNLPEAIISTSFTVFHVSIRSAYSRHSSILLASVTSQTLLFVTSFHHRPGKLNETICSLGMFELRWDSDSISMPTQSFFPSVKFQWPFTLLIADLVKWNVVFLNSNIYFQISCLFSPILSCKLFQHYKPFGHLHLTKIVFLTSLEAPSVTAKILNTGTF